MNGTLALANSIVALDREALAQLVSSRHIADPTSVQDPLGLALELLRAESISRAIEMLDREALLTLSTWGSPAAEDGATAADALHSADAPLRSTSNAASAPASSPEVSLLLRSGLLGIHDGTPVALPEVVQAVHRAQRASDNFRSVPGEAAATQGFDSGFHASFRAGHAVGHEASQDNAQHSDQVGSQPLVDHGVSGTALIDASSQLGRPVSANHADWYVAALTSVQRSAALLRALQLQPGKVNRRGTIAVATVRALAESVQASVEEVQRALTSLELAGLTSAPKSAVNGIAKLTVTTAAFTWLAAPQHERWTMLAHARISSVGLQLRACIELVGANLRAAAGPVLAQQFPLLPDSNKLAIDEFVAAAEDLGLTVDGLLTDPAHLLFNHEFDAAVQLTRRHMPEPVSGVYLQPDLTIIVPGPLEPANEQFIYSLAVGEQFGVAATLRITPESLARALDSGLTSTQLREGLQQLSLTGIPQPVSFLLSEMAEGSVITVHEHLGDEGRTRISISRPHLAEAMRIDRALQHLHLIPGYAAAGSHSSPAENDVSARQLFSRFSAEHVLSTLVDARYPATAAASRTPDAEDHFGGNLPVITSVTPTITGAPINGAQSADTAADQTTVDGSATSGPALPTLAPALQSLVDRVYEAGREEPSTGDVARRLDLAIRDRSPVRLTATAQGKDHHFTLLPVSLSGGRLRATDVAAGVERTLPLSAIVAVLPASQ